MNKRIYFPPAIDMTMDLFNVNEDAPEPLNKAIAEQILERGEEILRIVDIYLNGGIADA